MFNPLKKLQRLAALSALAAVIVGCSDGADSPQTEPFFPAPEEEWTMVWSDEFDGDSLNTANWDIQEGDGSEFGLERWGNNEQQWYSANNLTVADGNLTINARSEELVAGFPYTSGRIRTYEKFDFKYGRVEASVQAAPGQGLWSAFWMLSTNSPYNGWASSGEVDIMEVINADTDGEAVFGTLHYGFPWPLNQQAGNPVEDVAPADDYYLYAVEWSENEIRWYVDNVHYLTVNKDTWYSYYYADQQTGYTEGAGAAPFDVDFHVLLNLAVGGNTPGEVDDGDLPSDMVIDYVRVYSCSVNPETGSGCNTNADRNLEAAAPQEPFEDSFDLYIDQAEALEWTIAGETVSRQLAVNSFWDNDGALSFSEVESGDAERGTIIDVTTSNSGNISINAVDGEPTRLFGMGNNPAFWELHAAELKFDLYVDSSGTDPESSILIKMDSGWPAVGSAELKVADLPADAWTTISVQVNELLASRGEGLEPLDTTEIISFFVLEPTSSAHVWVDNIELACGHPAQNGCGILPPGGEVGGEIVNVFIDDVDPIWTNGFGAWDDVFLADYYDGNTANHVTWSVLSSGDPEHNEIARANFGTSGANGVWYIQSAAGVDLSAFAAAGKLIFDLKLEAGSTHGITYKVDCFFPCSSGDQVLDVSGDVRGEWNTHEITVASLISAGLDISNVNSALVIFPTWGDQQGVSFEVDNIRYENPVDGGGPVGPPTLAGTWRMAPEAGSLGVGPAPGDGSWFSCDDACVEQRACYFDDDYVFGSDGSFQNVLGDDTWIEPWQGSDPEACGAPVAPHDGLNAATWSYDEEAGTFTLDGTGAYVGLAKANNEGELTDPAAAPPTITYTVSFEDNSTINVFIESGTGSGVFWNYKMIKVAEPPPPPPFVGTWKMAPEAGSLGVGPAPGDGSWFSCDDACIEQRACYFDDSYVFSADGTFQNVLQDETWIEPWQGSDPEACGAPVAPHDGLNAATWSYDEGAGSLTLDGTGAYIGLAKANNEGELTDPAAAPSTITYEVIFEDSSTVRMYIESGTGSGVYWNYKLVLE
jgi:beta-glucanase (GH16 family)